MLRYIVLLLTLPVMGLLKHPPDIGGHNIPPIIYVFMNTKILTKFQLYILKCSHFTGISSICHLYSALIIKTSFCEPRPSKNGHSFISWNDKAVKFGQNLSNIWIWKVRKCVTKNKILLNQFACHYYYTLLTNVTSKDTPRKSI